MMPWWDDKRIEWYRRAAERSSFHRALASVIGKIAGKDEYIFEIGCGLGYTAEMLARDGWKIEATDADSRAIEEAERRSQLPVFSLIDARGPLPQSDILLMIFFGRIAEEDSLDHYLSSTGKIIYIISEHRGQSGRLRKKDGEPERTEEYLEKRNDIVFTRTSLSHPFPQPLRSEEEGGEFIERMYGKERKDEYMKFLQPSGGSEFPLLFPNEKHISVFTIERRKR